MKHNAIGMRDKSCAYCLHVRYRYWEIDAGCVFVPIDDLAPHEVVVAGKSDPLDKYDNNCPEYMNIQLDRTRAHCKRTEQDAEQDTEMYIVRMTELMGQYAIGFDTLDWLGMALNGQIP